MGNALSSMTGFAREEGAKDDWRWVWEVKSVNGRNLEARCRLPHGYDALETEIRKAAKERLARGNINVNLTLMEPSDLTRFRINEATLKEVIAGIRHIGEKVYCAPSRPEGILALRGVMEPLEAIEGEGNHEGLADALLASFRNTLGRLVEARKVEGATLARILAALFDDVERLVNNASSCAQDAPEALKARISAQLNELLADVKIPEERLAQEAALLAMKADVREELDRLKSHLAAGRGLLRENGPVGRQLEFLIQEFNREANTLCSKASDMELKRIGLELKTVIDQMREQAQNIE